MYSDNNKKIEKLKVLPKWGTLCDCSDSQLGGQYIIVDNICEWYCEKCGGLK